MRRSLSVTLPLLALATVGVACSGGGGSSSANAVLAGTWQWVSGPLISGTSFGNIGYLELATVGTGTLFTTTLTQGFPGCEPVTAAVIGADLVTLDLPDYARSNVLPLFRFTLSGDTLTFTDVYGTVATTTVFRRASAVPEAQSCTPVTPVRSYSIPTFWQIQFGYPVGIAATTTALWFSPAVGGALSLNPATGTTSSYVAISGQISDVLAMQGNDFWAFCNCGGEPFGLYDLTGAAVGPTYSLPTTSPFGLNGFAFDGSHLWASAYNFTLQKYDLLKLDTTTNPVGILADTPLDINPQTIAFRGGQLWVMANVGPPELLVMDTAGHPQAAYVFPYDGAWRGGIGAAVPGSIYVGRQGATQSESFIDRLAL